MKRFYTTLVMAGLFLVALAYILIVEQKIKPENEKIAKDKLKISQFTKENINLITLKRADQEVVLSRFEVDKWQIKKPIELEASSEEINRMVDTFSEAVLEENQQDNQPKDLSPFGLNPAKVTVTISNGKDQTQTLLLGDNVPVGSGFFGKFSDRPNVYVMPGNLLNAFDKGLNDLRKKKVADFSLASIQEIGWQFKGNNLKFYRDPESQTWNISKPFNTDAADTEVTDVVTQLTQLEAEAFVSENMQDQEKYRVSESQINRLELTVKEGSATKLVTYLIGEDSTIKDKYYLRVSGKNSIFQTKNSLEKKLIQSANDYREKKIFNFNKEGVQKIEMEQPNQKLFINKKPDGNWETVKQEGLDSGSTVDLTKVEDLLGRLKEVTALKFIEDTKVLGSRLKGTQKTTISLFNEQTIGKPKNLGAFTIYLLDPAQKGKAPLLVSAQMPNLPLIYAEIKEDNGSNLGIKSLLTKIPNQVGNKPDSSAKEHVSMNKLEPTLKDKSEIKKLPASIVEKGKKYTAIIHTAKGDMEIDLLADKSPYTVSNFINLARNHYYDGLKFHRVIAGFMAQGGDPTGTGSGGPGYQFADEFSDAKHERGSLSMANAGPNTNGSQFFICFQPQPHLNNRHTVFGNVSKGIEVLDQIKQNDVMTSVEVFEQGSKKS